MNDINIIVQGPISVESVENILNYMKFGKVLISTWNTSDLTIANNFLRDNNIENEVQIYTEDEPKWKAPISDTLNYQIQGIYNALLKCDKKYTIRVRSDEYFTYLKPMIDLFYEDDSKLVMANVHFRNSIPYHMGDHCFIAKTEVLLDAYKSLLPDENGSFGESWKFSRTPEVIMAHSILKSMNKEINPKSFNENFRIMDVNKLGHFIVRANHYTPKRTWVDHYEHWSRDYIENYFYRRPEMNKKIKLLILDVDGVLTNGKKSYSTDGLALSKEFCDRDFTAIKRFKAGGTQVCFLSGDRKVNEAVAKNRNIDFYFSDAGHGDKAEFVEEFESKYNCTKDEMAYVGDDLFDISIMKKVKYAFSPKNVPKEVSDVCDIIINRNSGDNVVATLYEYLLGVNLINQSTLGDVKNLDKLESF